MRVPSRSMQTGATIRSSVLSLLGERTLTGFAPPWCPYDPRRHHRAGPLGPLAGRRGARQDRRHPLRRRLYPHARDGGRLLPRRRPCRSRTAIEESSPIPISTRWCWPPRTARMPSRSLAAAVAGKHIHVEKPITLDRGSADAAVAAAHKRRHRAGGRLQPALPSVGRGNPQAPGRRPARHGDVHGGAAHHLDRRSSSPPDNWRAAAGRSAGRRAHRGRRAFDRPHDRVRRPGARRALRHRPLHARPVRRHHQRHAAFRERRHRASLLLGRDRHELSASRSTAPRDWRRFSQPNLSALPLRADARPTRRPAR